MARWPFFLEGSRFDNKEGGLEPGGPLIWEFDGVRPTDAAYRETWSVEFRNMIEAFTTAGKKVILVYPVPEMGWVVPARAALQEHYNGKAAAPVSISISVIKDRTKNVDSIFNVLPEDESLIRINPFEVFCDTWIPGRWAAQRDAELMYYDDDHLSIPGATLMVNKMVKKGIFSPTQELE